MWKLLKAFVRRSSAHGGSLSSRPATPGPRPGVTCKRCLFDRGTCAHPDGPHLFPTTCGGFACNHRYEVLWEVRKHLTLHAGRPGHEL
ncbi:MAG: hypothetical protein M0T85_14255 [Dehalococcoidales bacterium]|nr:hypothetical protein [Dehalococcoidales bacterium]